MKLKDILIVKVGTSTLANQTNASLDVESFTRIGRQLHTLHEQGYGIMVVSSAAITAGMHQTATTIRPTKMPELQRLASIGWKEVLSQWTAALNGYLIGELLLTKREIEAAKESNELVKVIHSLLSHGDISLINENDAITHAEIAFGDNDSLAASLAAKIKTSSLFADCTVKLVILSDVDGVYQDRNDASTLISTIDDVEQFTHLAGSAGSKHGTGGMQTKFIAASIARKAGVEMWIGNGRTENAILDTLNGKAGTHFKIS